MGVSRLVTRRRLDLQADSQDILEYEGAWRFRVVADSSMRGRATGDAPPLANPLQANTRFRKARARTGSAADDEAPSTMPSGPYQGTTARQAQTADNHHEIGLSWRLGIFGLLVDGVRRRRASCPHTRQCSRYPIMLAHRPPALAA